MTMTLSIMPLFIGTTEMIIIAGIALLLFGGKKLPEMMRGLGQGLSEFKKAAKDVSEPVKNAGKDVNTAAEDADETMK